MQNQIDIFRLPVGREPPHFVLPGVDAEAGEISERAVEQPERMGKSQRFEQLNRIPSVRPMLAVSDSPTPSMVRMAASSNGEGKKALAACAS